jgi:modulator of FtsH protease HflK
MAFNEPNGRDPWGNRPNDGPPDLNEVFDRIIAAWRNLFGKPPTGGARRGTEGGSGSNAVAIVLVLAVALVVLGFEVTKLVDPGERAVVLRFGKPVAVLQPGLSFRWPRPIEYVERENVDQVRSISHHAAMLTKDENIIEIDMAVQYKIASVEDYIFKVREPGDTLRQAAETSIREVIGSSTMDHVLTSGRSEVSLRTAESMQRLLDFYEAGLSVDSVNILSAKPPEQVKSAFDDAIKAREDEQRLINEAEAYRKEVVPKSQGGAARLVEEGTAYREEVVARARGEAARFTQLLAAYREAPELTRQRLHLDTLEEVYRRSSKILMDGTQGQNVMVLPLEGLMKGLRPTVAGDALPAVLPEVVPEFGNPQDEASARQSRSRERDRP